MLQSNSGFFSSIPPVTKNILIINLLFWLADTLLSTRGINLSQTLGLHYISSDYFKPHQIITYMFMHGGFSHVFFNMFAVFMFGRTLETVWGPKKFLTYYILTGIGAALIQLLIYYLRLKNLEANISPELLTSVYNEIHSNGLNLLLSNKNYADPTVGSMNLLINGVMVGASGAVFGILIAFGMLFPNVELIMIPIPIPIKAKWFVIGYGVIELFAGMADRPNDNVAHFAHLGGLLVGFIIVLIWKRNARRNGRYF